MGVSALCRKTHLDARRLTTANQQREVFEKCVAHDLLVSILSVGPTSGERGLLLSPVRYLEAAIVLRSNPPPAEHVAVDAREVLLFSEGVALL